MHQQLVAKLRDCLVQEEEEDLLLFAALRRTKYNQKYKLKKQHDRIHIASSIDTSIADCSA